MMHDAQQTSIDKLCPTTTGALGGGGFDFNAPSSFGGGGSSGGGGAAADTTAASFAFNAGSGSSGGRGAAAMTSATSTPFDFGGGGNIGGFGNSNSSIAAPNNSEYRALVLRSFASLAVAFAFPALRTTKFDQQNFCTSQQVHSEAVVEAPG